MDLLPEDIRTYQVYLANERKLTPKSILIAVSANGFLYKVTLKKDWSFEEARARRYRRQPGDDQRDPGATSAAELL